jgi:FMN phosphatase YigB (HAD superfamily)
MFDLDGTLLPMRQKLFLELYIKELTQKMETYGFSPKAVVKALWDGTDAMINNDGKQTNEECFWARFALHLGNKVLEMKPILERFYEEEFNNAKPAVQQNPQAKELVHYLRDKGCFLVLASNPVFPLCAYETRLSWLGLSCSDFDYVTHYQNSHYCKPNPLYYAEILQNINKDAADCLMVGNDVPEDYNATKANINFYLITDNLINADNMDLSKINKSSFAEFDEKIRQECCNFTKR